MHLCFFGKYKTGACSTLKINSGACSFLSTSIGYQYLDGLDYITQEMDDWFLVGQQTPMLCRYLYSPGTKREVCDFGRSITDESAFA